MKKIFVMLISLLVLLTMTACSFEQGSIEAVSEDENTYTVNFDNAGKDMSASTELTIEENQIVNFSHQLEIDDSVKVVFKDQNNQVVMDLDLNDAGGGQTYLQPGTYTLEVNVLEKANGNVTFTIGEIQKDEEIANPWKTAANVQEALDATGIKFVEPIKEALPANVEYANCFYTEDIVQVLYGASENYLYIRISKNHEGKEDLAGDYNQYPSTWHQSVKGLDVTCYSDNDKIYLATFTSGDQNYSINYNMYPDGNGLTADELNSLLNGMQ